MPKRRGSVISRLKSGARFGKRSEERSKRRRTRKEKSESVRQRSGLCNSFPNKVIDFLRNFHMSWLACGVCVASLAGGGRPRVGATVLEITALICNFVYSLE